MEPSQGLIQFITPAGRGMATDRNSFHLAPVEFAIEKEAEAMRLADRAAQRVNGPGEAGGGVSEVMFFQFDGVDARFFDGVSQAREKFE